jgi:hypothetical protein
MLDKTNYHAATAGVTIISGQSISKANWPTWQRAVLAARWQLGLITVKPGTKLASTVFGVSQPLVRGAVAKLGPTINGSKVPAIDREWDRMSDGERFAFVGAHLSEVWSYVDRVTA